MKNFNFEWMESGDNFVGDIKVNKTTISISPMFKKHIVGKNKVLFSATEDELILGFLNGQQHSNGLKKASIHPNGKTFSFPTTLGKRFEKGHYNLDYMGHEDGIAAYKLIKI